MNFKRKDIIGYRFIRFPQSNTDNDEILSSFPSIFGNDYMGNIEVFTKISLNVYLDTTLLKQNPQTFDFDCFKNVEIPNKHVPLNGKYLSLNHS